MAKANNKKRAPRASKQIDKSQNKRIKALEGFVFKTIENKQLNFTQSAAVSVTGYSLGGFLANQTGVEDGANINDPARIGNSTTLMKQELYMNLEIPDQSLPGSEAYNRMRVILVESLDGNQPISFQDCLLYPTYGIHGSQVFVSPYTTKATTNRRYKIHMDRVVDLNIYKNPHVTLKTTIKYSENGSPGKVLMYDAPAGTSVLPSNHRLTLLAVSDSASVAHPVMNYSIRSTYKDA